MCSFNKIDPGPRFRMQKVFKTNRYERDEGLQGGRGDGEVGVVTGSGLGNCWSCFDPLQYLLSQLLQLKSRRVITRLHSSVSLMCND